ncbi:ATP-binding protein [Streptomyces sp. NBC_00441]|uniref:sensor histidine kinase n=1 Tax=Streptomyces sp. NBC_00441 TaxID=2975742 RepID=UPI002E283648|nr:ATP-binding protein [Streptomyces sp. NBC_00441]
MRPSTRPTALALLVTVALTAVLSVWATFAAPESARTAVAWGSGGAALLLVAAVTTAVHARATVRRLRETHAAESGRFTAEVSRMVSASAAEAQKFTAESARLRAAAAAETARAKEEAEAGTARLTAENARLKARASRAETERSAALTSCANAAGRMQALATSMLADLREMEHRHTSEDVLADLLHLDHRTAQAGRLADSIAVLTGARSGRRWAKPIVMESVLRGAMGRISGYQRVRLHSTSDVAVSGHAAEGVMHALAELLDNAANFSPPTAEVHVYVEEVPAGIVVTVEDSGLVMSDVQLRRAERAVTAADADLTGLTGTRLGLAVVGRLARKHGLTVSFRPSARGGTGALMMLPQEIVTRATAPRTAPEPAPAPAETEPEPVHTLGTDPAARPPAQEPLRSDSASETTGNLPKFGDSGLPKRSRGRTLAAAEARATASGPARETGAKDDAPDPKARAARFSSFRNAVRPDSPPPEDSSR